MSNGVCPYSYYCVYLLTYLLEGTCKAPNSTDVLNGALHGESEGLLEKLGLQFGSECLKSREVVVVVLTGRVRRRADCNFFLKE